MTCVNFIFPSPSKTNNIVRGCVVMSDAPQRFMKINIPNYLKIITSPIIALAFPPDT